VFDLILKGGTVIDPSRGLHQKLDVAISGGKIAAVREEIPECEAAKTLDVSGKLVVPGLVDLHVHMYLGGTALGADPDETCLRHGVTTVLDCGSFGSDNFEGFRRWIAERCNTRVYSLIHLSCLGLVGIGKAGELANPAYADPEGAMEILRRYPDLVLGLKMRATESVVGGSCLPALRMARRVADEVGVPLMVHIGRSREPLPDILSYLKTGDIITHCATPRLNGLLDGNGRILPQVWEARQRGVVFDSAHGRPHFSFVTAGRLLDQGFLPDAISTDLTNVSAKESVLDLPTTMTKWLALGMPLDEVIALVTYRPAQILGKADLFGSLRDGLEADVAVLEWKEGEFGLKDGAGEVRTVHERLAPHVTVRAGRLFYPNIEN